MVSFENGEGAALPAPNPKLEPVSYEPHGPHGLVGPVEPNYAQKDHVRGLCWQFATCAFVFLDTHPACEVLCCGFLQQVGDLIKLKLILVTLH